MNNEKSATYKKLVADMQKKYPVYTAKNLANFFQAVNKKGTPAAKLVVKKFVATFADKKDFYNALKNFGLTWMQVDNQAIYEMRAKEALRIAVENGFDPFNAFTSKDAPIKLFAPVVDGENICQEINFYTYWQGLGYAEKTPKIKYLLVAQDWGNLNLSQDFIDSIKKWNTGDRTPLYTEKPTGIGTDTNLFKLFEVLGYDLSKRYDELFFTNFCLGYRSADTNAVGGMTKKLLMNDATEFKRLCEILEPENILCLGKITAECVYKALKGFELKDAYGDAKTYNEFLDRQAVLVAAYGENDRVLSNIYALAHCGYMGTLGRPLEKQMEDWKQIFEEKKIDSAIENFCHTNTEENKNRVLEEIFARVKNNATLIIAQQNFGDGNFLDDFIPIFKNIKSVFLTSKIDGKTFLATFTNLFEFAKFNENSGRKFTFMYVPAEKLLYDCLRSDDGSEGIILNPAAENYFRLTRDMIRNFSDKKI